VLTTLGPAQNPSLSPDGRFVAFETADGTGDYSVYVMEIARAQVESAAPAAGARRYSHTAAGCPIQIHATKSTSGGSVPSPRIFVMS
jgi:hypothetical protein